MTFLDSSVIIDMMEGKPEVVERMEEFDQPYLTSAICVFEVLNGKLGSGETDIMSVRQDFHGVESLDLTERVVHEAARMQDQMLSDGEPMKPRDVLIAATARSTGDELVVADSDFDTDHLNSVLDITNFEG